MKYVWSVALLLNFAFFAPTQAQAQEATAHPSTSPAGASKPNLVDELAQAQQTADRFIQTFKATRDLTPLIVEMFTSDVKKTVGQDDSWSGTVGVGRSLTEHLNAEDRLKCFIAAFNLRYLLRLCLAGKLSLDSAEKATVEDFLSPEAVEFFKNHSLEEGMVETNEQAQKHLAFYESAVIVMRKEIVKSPPEETTEFKQNLVDFEAHLQQYKEEQPGVYMLKEADNFGHPTGTLIARIIIPFHVGLVMVKEGGKYKIWLAMTDLPPD